MSKSGLFLALLVMGVLVTGSVYAADKFATMDVARTFSEYYKTKDYDKVLGDKEGSYQSEREKMINDVKSLQDKMNLLADKEKDAKKKDLEEKIKGLQDFDKQKMGDLRKDQEEKMKELIKDINEAVKQYATKEGFTMVYNDKVFAYVDKSYDVTDKVIAILNANKPAEKPAKK